nr:MAG TPA: hypothetical protein [Caudoviricetes sp.]
MEWVLSLCLYYSQNASKLQVILSLFAGTPCIPLPVLL